MVYDFCTKIKNVKKAELLDLETLKESVAAIDEKFSTKMELRFILPVDSGENEMLIKSQVSVSTMSNLHDKELETFVSAFKEYVWAYADYLGGEVSRQDGFYNNSKIFKRLFG